MKKGLGILIALLFMGTAFGQDAKAKAILDKVSAKTKDYKNIAIDFKLTISGADIEPITESGKAFMEGDKYKVELRDQDIYCDGKTITTHLKEDKECYTSSVAESQGEGMMAPTKMLTIWEDGFNYKYDKENTYKGKAVHQISLFPKKPADSKYHTIILNIDKEKNEVVMVYIKGKDGTNMKYELTKFQNDISMPASKFVFNRAQHPDVECYDE